MQQGFAKKAVSVFMSIVLVLGLNPAVALADEHDAPSGEHGTASDEHDAPSSEHGSASSEHGSASSEHSAASGEHDAPSSEHVAASNEHGTAVAPASVPDGVLEGQEAGSPVAVLYTNGELIFQATATAESGRMIDTVFQMPGTYESPKWNGESGSTAGVGNANKVKKVSFKTQVSPTSLLNWFYNCVNLEEITGMATYLGTSNVNNMSSLFYGCSKLTQIDVSQFSMTNVTNTSFMFAGCSGVTSLATSGFNTPNLSNMEGMFSGCSSLTSLDLSNFDARNVAWLGNRYGDIFANCSSLSSVTLGANFRFLTDETIKYALPTPPSTEPYTGKWVKQGSTTPYSPADLVTAFNANPATMAGTWVWETAGGPEPVDIDITGAEVALSATSFTFNGAAQTPSVTSVKVDGNAVPSASYDITYPSSSTNKGTYTVTVTGKNGYTGTASAQYSIAAASITASMIDAIADQPYTGNEVKPAVTVRFNGSSLSAGTDFTVSYASNTQVGEATVTVSGQNNFTGTANATFNIVRSSGTYLASTDGLRFENKAAYSDSSAKIDLTYYTRLMGDEYGTLLHDAFLEAGGLCYGYSTLAMSSAKNAYPAVSGIHNGSTYAAKLYDAGENWDSGETLYGENLSVLDFIKYCFVAQFDRDLQGEAHFYSNHKNNYAGLVAAVKQSEAGGEPIDVAINSGVGGGHSLWALRVDETDASKAKIVVYDSNHPGEERPVYLFKQGGSYRGWAYDLGYGTVWGNCSLDGNAISGSAAYISWDTPADNLHEILARNGNYNRFAADAESKFKWKKEAILSADQDVTLVSGGKEIEVGANKPDTDSIYHLPVSVDVASRAAGNVYFADLSDEVLVQDVDSATKLGISDGVGGVNLALPAGSEAVVTVQDGASNNSAVVNLEQANSKDFQVVYHDDKSPDAAGGYEKVTIQGSGSTAVETEQLTSGNISVSGATSLTVTNSDGEVDSFTGLSAGSTYTVLPTAGAGGKPTIEAKTIVGTGKWGTCDWEIDSDGVITVHPGTGVDVEANYSGPGAGPWKEYKDTATKIVFVQQDGKKVIAPANCNQLLYGMGKLVEVDFSGLDTSRTTSMESLLNGCAKLTTVNAAELKTSKVTNMGSMFRGCAQLQKLDLVGFDTANVTDMSFMFANCEKLKSVDLSSFNTAKLSQNTDDTHNMFVCCSALEHVSVGAGVTKLYEMKWGYASETWYSMATGQQFTSSQIKASRMGIADSYTKSLSGTNIEYAAVTGIRDYAYTGSGITQGEMKVQLNGQTLVRGTHYDLEYLNNTAVGTATVLMTAIPSSGYQGSLTRVFAITSAPAPTPTPTPTPKPTPTPTPTPTPKPAASSRAMHRLYNPWSGEHFYTADVSERNNLTRLGWTYEGVGWNAPTSGKDVHRLYNPYTGEHHFTPDTAEKNACVAAGWRYEGVGWKSGGNVKVYREYNPYAPAFYHNYTRDPKEHAYLCSIGWVDEGTGWYGV